MAGDRAFEKQFKWEVDRWVFRHNHRGDPIEVTAEERDRIIALHRARQSSGSRVLCGVPLASLLLLGWKHLLIAWSIVLVSMLIGIPAFIIWARYDCEKQIRGKPLLGMPLKPVGRLARDAEEFTWLEVLGSLAVIVLLILFALWIRTIPSYAQDQFLTVGMFLLIAPAFLFIGAMAAAKWAQHERTRLHDEQMEAIQRARRLGGE